MKETEQDLLIQKIAEAKHPEGIFGSLEGIEDPLKAVFSTYRRFSKLTHPDLNGGSNSSHEAFIKLTRYWEDAKLKIQSGTYGEIPPESITIIRTNLREYEVFETTAQTDFCNIHSAKYKEGGADIPVLFKVAKSPLDNEFVETEAKTLRKLKEADNFDKFHPYFPDLTDSFIFEDNNRVRKSINVFAKKPDKFYSFSEVKSAYPDGIDPKDMAWIFRRVLVGIGFAHQSGVIHGAVLPENLFIQPEKHGLVINEWSYSVTEPKGHLLAVSGDFENWYPPEVFKKEPATPGPDIYLGAKNMVYLLGGDIRSGNLPDNIHSRLRAFFRDCLLPSPNQRPQDAWDLLQEFDQLIERLWGSKKFHLFSMPKKTERR